MHTYKLLLVILAVSLASAGMASCSGNHPAIVHLDFADAVNVVLPSMGEQDSGHYKIDSSIRNSDVYFLVNETNAKYYAEPVVEKFIDTNRFIREEIAKRYNKLTVHFYHRGDKTGGDDTDYLLKTRSTKVLGLFNNDIISEYVWRDGRPADTLFFDHGRLMGGPDIKLEDMRKKKKP